jgi:hypothetical protein
MKSVADDLRAELREKMRHLSVQERLDLALRLGEESLELFRQANGLDRKTAIRLLQRRRQAGRRPSKCMSELIG